MDLMSHLAVGFGVSLLPDISMAGHIGGIIGGVLAALFITLPRHYQDERE